MDPDAVDEALLAGFADDDPDDEGDATLSSGELSPIFIDDEDTTDPSGHARPAPSEVPTAPRLTREELAEIEAQAQAQDDVIAHPQAAAKDKDKDKDKERETIPPSAGERDYVMDLERRLRRESDDL
jgi:hypothetical protein